MKGLILVGGLGTQLRPLTLSKAKPLIEFCNRAQLQHQLEMLKQAGVTEVVLAINYRPEIMADFLEANADNGIKITLSQEQEPLGTAGPLALAKDLLNDGEPFFVMNCDVACEFNLRALLDFHNAHGKVGTIMVTPVDEPAKYGKSVVVPHDTGLIDRFVEHGRTFAGNLINAGVYIFSPQIFDRLSLRPTSMEKEVLPSLAAEDQLYCQRLDGYWMNIKKPPDFLQGTALSLAYMRKHRPADLSGGVAGSSIEGNVLIDSTAQVGLDCKLGPDVVLGPGCVVEDGVRLQRCILLEGVRVCSHAVVLDSICGWRSTVGSWARVEGVSVLGEDVHIDAELCINGALILPHKTIGDSVTTPQIIM
jgi:mannose-1-phosphate guanylyltransferase